MSLNVPCPECAVALAIPDEIVGKTIRCKSCGASFKAKVPSHSDKNGEQLRRDRERPVRTIRDAGDDADADQISEPRKRSGQVGRRRKKKRAKSNVGYIILTVSVAAVLSVGLAYMFGAFNSTKDTKSDGSITNNNNDKPIRTGAAARDEVIEEITIQAITVQNDDGDGSPGFAYGYRWNSGRVPTGTYFEVRSIPGVQTKESPFDGGMVEGLIQYTQAGRGASKFDIWIAKRKSAHGPAALARVSNILHIGVK